MKVEPCCAETVIQKPKELTWGEMIENEGVYQHVEDVDERFIVLHSDDGESVLYYDPEFSLMLSAVNEPSYTDNCFIRREDEVVQFGIKKIS